MNKTIAIFGFIGIALTISGWFLANSERFPFVYSVLGQKYLRAEAALKKLTKENNVQEGDKGFSELANLIMNKFIKMSEQEREKAKRLGIKINKIEVLENFMTFKEKAAEIKTGTTLKLRVSYNNGQAIEGNAFDISSLIKERYLSNQLFKWGSFIFWVGIVISIIIIIVGNFFTGSPQKE